MASDETQEIPAEQVRARLEAVKGPESVLEALVARREELMPERLYDVEVPGYEGCLVLRLAPLTGAKIGRIQERALKSKSPEADFNVNADTIIAACQQVLGRRKPGAELVMLPGEDGEPVTIGEELADMLRIEHAKTSRSVLRQLFNRANSPDLAIAAAAGEYAEWAAGANAQMDEELLGES